MDRRQPPDIHTTLYNNGIGPGADLLVRYSLRVPRDARGAVTFNNPNAVSTLSGSAGQGLQGAAFQFVNTGALTVGTIGNQAGVSATGEVRIRANTGDLILASNVTAGANFSVSGPSRQPAALVATAGNVTETTTGLVTASSLIVNAPTGR